MIAGSRFITPGNPDPYSCQSINHGKAFNVNMPVMTVCGWKRHGRIVPGDFVFNPDGEPVEVQAVTVPYIHPLCEITFENGETLNTTAEHEWKFLYANASMQEPEKIKETKKIRITKHYKYDPPSYPFVKRYEASNELARNNGGIVMRDHYVKIINIKTSNKKHHVNCIQAEGGMYLIGKSLMPTHNSEILSRKLPAHFLGLFPDSKVLMTGHKRLSCFVTF